MTLSIDDLFRMPSEADLDARARASVALAAPFRLDAWSQDVAALSLPTETLPLSDAERDAIVQIWAIRMGDDAPPPPAEIRSALAARLDDAVARAGRRAFVRLATRSPKDNFEILDDQGRPLPIGTGQAALDALTGSMERVYRDLDDDRRAGAVSAVCIRPFVEIGADQEFRCFVEQREIAGITQYHLGDDAPRLRGRADMPDVEAAIRAFLAERLLPLVAWPSFTADLVLRPGAEALEVLLLETNPPVSSGRVFPGLFDDGILDGGFRLL